MFWGCLSLCPFHPFCNIEARSGRFGLYGYHQTLQGVSRGTKVPLIFSGLAASPPLRTNHCQNSLSHPGVISGRTGPTTSGFRPHILRLPGTCAETGGDYEHRHNAFSIPPKRRQGPEEILRALAVERESDGNQSRGIKQPGFMMPLGSRASCILVSSS